MRAIPACLFITALIKLGKKIIYFPTSRAEGFGIWPTLSEPVQIRVGILNQLTDAALTDIVGRLSDAMLKMGASFDKDSVMSNLANYLAGQRAA